MLRIVFLMVLLLASIYSMVFRPAGILKVVAGILYGRLSPLGRGNVPLWARYYLNGEAFEGPPPVAVHLEESVKSLGYGLIAVPIALAVTVALFGS